MDEACFTLHHINKHTIQMLELWGQATKCFEVQILFMLINNVDLIIKISTLICQYLHFYSAPCGS